MKVLHSGDFTPPLSASLCVCVLCVHGTPDIIFAWVDPVLPSCKSCTLRFYRFKMFEILNSANFTKRRKIRVRASHFLNNLSCKYSILFLVMSVMMQKAIVLRCGYLTAAFVLVSVQVLSVSLFFLAKRLYLEFLDQKSFELSRLGIGSHACRPRFRIQFPPYVECFSTNHVLVHLSVTCTSLVTRNAILLAGWLIAIKQVVSSLICNGFVTFSA